jgi:hypothetical protein
VLLPPPPLLLRHLYAGEAALDTRCSAHTTLTAATPAAAAALGIRCSPQCMRGPKVVDHQGNHRQHQGSLLHPQCTQGPVAAHRRTQRRTLHHRLQDQGVAAFRTRRSPTLGARCTCERAYRPIVGLYMNGGFPLYCDSCGVNCSQHRKKDRRWIQSEGPMG